MRKFSLLRSQLLAAWHKTIEGQYAEQLINSERGLQVYFCKHLLDQFEEKQKSRRLFIEPSVTFEDTAPRRVPDIVICDENKIIGVVEIKYQPRAKPSFIKDLETLDSFLKSGNCVELANHRYRGERKALQKFELAPDVVLCWAGVYKAPIASVRHPDERIINERVMVLSAVTQSGQRAAVSPSRRVAK